MRLPVSAHTERPWRIHDIASDFQIEDVWSFDTPGAGPDDFPTMLAAIRAHGSPESASPVVRFLFAVRWKLGELLGWDKRDKTPYLREGSLRDRLPADLPPAPLTSRDAKESFIRVYELPREAVNELGSKTVHAVMHLGWVAKEDGQYQLRMAVLVKPSGWLGRCYMAAIKPFRYLIVYPALTRSWEAAWRQRATLFAEG